MDENAALQARIASLAGRINRHKADTPDSHSEFSQSSKRQAWSPQRGAPYASPRGRGWSSRAPPVRNRTLVINNSKNDAASSATAQGSQGWVTKRDRHMQLINNTVYEQKTQQRTEAMAQSRAEKAKKREEREKAMLAGHLRSLVTSTPSTSSAGAKDHYITVGKARFVVAAGGSKLIRADGEVNTGQHLHRRDKQGISYAQESQPWRRDLLQKPKWQFVPGRPCQQPPPVFLQEAVTKFRSTNVQKKQTPCQQFSTTGLCSKGPNCRYIHDPERVALCKDFIQKGECAAGDFCDLSHDLTPERVPHCLHFLRGHCTKADCKYSHVPVSPGAPVCKAFALFGYCTDGASCTSRHVHECPDYANTGVCRNKSCHLPHIDRAGQLRKAATNAQMDDAMTDVSSEGEGDSDDFDSDDIDDTYLHAAGNAIDMSGQADFVHL